MFKIVVPLVLLATGLGSFWFYRNADERLLAARDSDRAVFARQVGPEITRLEQLNARQEELARQRELLEREFTARCDAITTNALEQMEVLRSLAEEQPVQKQGMSSRRRALTVKRTRQVSSLRQLRDSRQGSLNEVAGEITAPQREVLNRKRHELSELASMPVKGRAEMEQRMQQLTLARQELMQIRSRQLDELDEALKARRESLDGRERAVTAAIRDTGRQISRLDRLPAARGRSNDDPSAGLLRTMKHDLQACRLDYASKMQGLNDRMEAALTQSADVCKRIEQLNRADEEHAQRRDRQLRDRKWCAGMASGVLLGTMALVSLARFTRRRP